MDIKEISLQNGLRVFEIPTNLGSNVISVDLFYDIGSKDEELGKTGIAHMLEHLNFKSTKNHKAGEFDEIIKSLGGINNASTGFDYTHYYIKCNSNSLTTALELFADMMENLKFLSKEFLPERDVVLEERFYRSENDPVGYMFFNMYAHAFTHSVYHHTPIGFEEDIKNLNIDDIKRFHKKFYNPNNAILLICGDTKGIDVFGLVSKFFDKIPNRIAKDNRFFRTEPNIKSEKIINLYKKTDVEMLSIGFVIPPFNHADQIPLEGLDDFLINGRNSLFHKILVEEKKLANQIDIYNLSSKFDNLFFILGICNEGIKAIDLRDEIFKLLNSKFEISDKDLEKIKNNIKSDFIYSLDSASKVGSLYGSYIIKGDLDYLLNYEKNLKSLKIPDIYEVRDKYLTKNNSTTIILKDLK